MYKIFDSTIISSLKAWSEEYIFGIDSGHGWLTGGKRSIDGSLRENEFNTAVEDKLAMLFHFCGIEYHQLAAGWKDEGLKARKKIEGELFLDAKTRGKMFVGISIHADAYNPDTSANGFCVYYYKKGSSVSTSGKHLARCVADSIIESDFQNNHIINPRHSNGIKGNNFFMLRETKGVWVLIENAFMSNDRDLSYLKDDGFRNNRAEAIFQGIFKYIRS